MKKMMGKGRIRKGIAVLLLLAAIAALFTDCGQKEGNAGKPDDAIASGSLMLPEKDSESVWRGEQVTTGFFNTHGYATMGEEEFVAMMPKGNGYQIYVDTPGGSHGVFSLDRGFEQSGFRELGNVRYLAHYFGQGRMSGSEYALETFLESGASDYGKVQFWICRDGEKLYQIPDPTDAFSASLLETEDGVYIADQSYLLFDEKQVRIPGVDWDERCAAYGFIRLGEKDYAVLRTDWMKTDGPWYLAELQGAKTGPLIETNIAGERFFPDAEGKITYYIKSFALWGTDGETREKILDFSSFGFAGTAIKNIWQEKDRFFILNERGLFRLTRQNDGKEEEKLVIGCVSLSSKAQGMIDRYNLSGRGKVEIRLLNDQQANLMLLSKEADLVVSRSPDQMFDWAKAGVLRPIGEFTELDGIYPNLVECGSRNGSCWFLPTDFTLWGCVANRCAVESGTVFKSAAELEKALEKLPQQHFYKDTTRDLVFDMVCGEEWIDPETNTAHFDDPSFVAMLEFLNRFAPDQDAAEANANRSGDFDLFDLFSPNYVCENWIEPWNMELWYEDYAEARPASGASAAGSIFPMPGNGRFQGLSIVSSALIAVAAKSDRDDMIRDFLSFLFQEGEMTAYNETLGFDARSCYLPNIKESETMIERELDDERYAGTGITATEEDFARFREEMSDMIRKADHYAPDVRQNTVWLIIHEEASRYFAGEITAEKAAEYVQNRISLMLAEKG